MTFCIDSDFSRLIPLIEASDKYSLVYSLIYNQKFHEKCFLLKRLEVEIKGPLSGAKPGFGKMKEVLKDKLPGQRWSFLRARHLFEKLFKDILERPLTSLFSF